LIIYFNKIAKFYKPIAIMSFFINDYYKYLIKIQLKFNYCKLSKFKEKRNKTNYTCLSV